MARKDQGEALTAPWLQPGWTISTDGFGLYTGKCTFKINRTEGLAAMTGFTRGAAHPVAPFSAYMSVHKGDMSSEHLGYVTLHADYVGINNGENDYTNPQVTEADSLTSESITSHPNFFTTICGPISGLAQNPNAPFVNVLATSGQIVQLHACTGLNGACFDTESGGRFIGFIDPAYPNYYGKTQYLAPTTAFSGIIYFTKTSSRIAAVKGAVGKTSGSNVFAGTKLLPDYIGTSFTGAGGLYQLLLSSVNFEDYGNVVKCIYEIRFNREGYPETVYPHA
jgi:hypothetical protein